ncbi:protein phosphatase 1 regulatory subunit 14A-like [Plectropomus leopardus]|uniref:protein phosphatase 1 regulatory subunit 14A-like n=1 Tax=Plectropomus leopardus TaxID=160734 RepID=UPI001C4BF1D4|nr:protein phosphatase 1 regulatory subunit 14A-like [Plectropomus leopardus]
MKLIIFEHYLSMIDVDTLMSLCLQEDAMPEGVNIDELLDLKTDEERTQRLQDVFHSCNNNTEVFICELLLKLDGLQKQDDLHDGGINISPAHSGSADTDALR